MGGEVFRAARAASLGEVGRARAHHAPHVADGDRDETRLFDLADANCDVHSFLAQLHVSIGQHNTPTNGRVTAQELEEQRGQLSPAEELSRGHDQQLALRRGTLPRPTAPPPSAPREGSYRFDVGLSRLGERDATLGEPRARGPRPDLQRRAQLAGRAPGDPGRPPAVIEHRAARDAFASRPFGAKLRRACSSSSSYTRRNSRRSTRT